MMGLGKSALSRTLGRRLGWPVVDKDDFSDVLMAHVEYYGPLAYESMFSVIESLLNQGFSVICDSPLRGQIGYERAKGLAEHYGAELRIISCTLSDESVWKARLEARERRPAHILKHWNDLLHYRSQAEADFDYAVVCPKLELDLATPLEQLAEKVITWLNEPLEGAG